VSHHCHAEGCEKSVPPKLMMCAPHWRMVPAWLQSATWKAYKPGQEITKQFTVSYWLVQWRCRLAVSDLEGRDRAPLFAELRRIFESANVPEMPVTRGQAIVLADYVIRNRILGGSSEGPDPGGEPDEHGGDPA